MGIFWSCLLTILGCCSYSIMLGDEPSKYTVILGGIAGFLIGLDFRLREIRNEIQTLKTKASY